MIVRTKKPAGVRAQYASAALCAILLSACASGGAEKGEVFGGDGDYKDAIGVFANTEADPNGMDPIAAAAFWGTRFDREPDNADVAVRYSHALRKIGSNEEAVGVMNKAIERAPQNPDVNLEMGKALVEGGRAFEAVRYLETALEVKVNDWRALSAYGVALDQIGEHETAREHYDKALLRAPDAVSVMSNKGLSYALDGDLDMAERTLRQAVSNRRGDARVRQNLALVLAIKGDMREAERLARSDLPPQIADQNVDYYRALLTQPAYWQEYAADTTDVPSFDSAPAPTPKPSAPTSVKPKEAPVQELREEKKEEPKADKDAPVALIEVTPPTNASAVREEAPELGEPLSDEETAPDLKN